MSDGITESVVEQCSLEWLSGLGYEILSGLTIAPGEPSAVRADYKQVFLFSRLQTKVEVLQTVLLPKLLSGELRVPAASGSMKASA